MEGWLISALSEESDEERRLLAGGVIEKNIYSSEGEFIINGARLRGGKSGISVRTHTRYADFPRHRHNYLEMMIVLCGSITHEIDEKLVKLNTGDVLLLNKHVHHGVRRAERGDIGVNVIMSDNLAEAVAPELSGTVFSTLFRENGRDGGAPMYLHFSAGQNKRQENLVENLLFELTDSDPNLAIIEKTVTLLLCSLAATPSLAIGGTLPESAEAKRVLDILSYIKNNFRTGSLSELAGRLYLSVPYLSKFIKENVGKSFKELVVEARMERARELIFDTDMPIGEIIRAVGYENESYFHREFRQRFSMTPLAMRKAARRNEPRDE